MSSHSDSFVEGSLIEFDGVALQRGGRTIVEDLSLRLGRGGVVVLHGPSGAGKTTVLRAAAGMLAPARGRLIRRVHRQGVLFQESRLLPWLSADRNVRLGAPDHSVWSWRRNPDTARLLTDLGLGAVLGERPHRLSGGMQRRVALARAVIGRPDVIFADEPFANLDPAAASVVAGVLRRAVAGGAAAVLTSHEPGDRLMSIGGHRTVSIEISGMLQKGVEIPWQTA